MYAVIRNNKNKNVKINFLFLYRVDETKMMH